VVLVPPKEYDPFFGFGLLTPGTVKVISLSSSICLVAKELTKDPEIIHIDSSGKDFSRWFNKITAVNSDRFVFSPEKGKLEKLVKETKKCFKTEVNIDIKKCGSTETTLNYMLKYISANKDEFQTGRRCFGWG